MKNILPLLFGAALLPLVANAQSYSNVVGYITHDIAANTGFAAGADTYLSPTLIQPAAFAGASNASPSGAATVNFDGTSVPTSLDQTYVLEITSAESEGWWSTVVSSTASSITVTDNFPAGLPANVSVAVRKHTTVKDFLGANAPGLVPFDMVSQNDEVQILDPVTQAATTLAYVPKEITGLPEDGWFDLGTSTPADGMVIEPGSAIKIKRFGATALSFVSAGEVKTTDTQCDVYPGDNWFGTHRAVGAALNDMDLETQLIVFDNINPNYDQLQDVQADQSTITYAAVDPAFFGYPTMANLGDSSDAGAVMFPEGTGMIIKRATSEAASVVTVPGTVVGP